MSDPSLTAPRRPPLAILIAVTASGPVAFNIFLPSMPGLRLALAADYGTVQLALTLFLVGFAVGQLVYGPLSDRFGRRPTLIGGLGLFFLGNLVCVTAPTIEALIAGRIVQAFGGIAGMVMSIAMVRDLYDRAHAASRIAYITMAMIVAPMVAPAIGGFLDDAFGWRAGFVFVLAYGVVVLAFTVVVLPETHLHRRGAGGFTDLFAGLRTLVRRPAFFGYGFQLAFVAAAFYAFAGGAPFVVIQMMGRPASHFGLYFIAISTMYMAGNFTAARVSTRVGIDRMIVFGMGVTVAGAAAMGVFLALGALTPLTLFGCMAVLVYGNGLSIPNGLAGAVSIAPAHAGAAAGLAGFLMMGTGGVVTYLVGVLMADSAAPMVVIMIAAAILAVVAYGLGVKRPGGGAD